MVKIKGNISYSSFLDGLIFFYISWENATKCGDESVVLNCARFKAQDAIESGGNNCGVVLTKNAVTFIHVVSICGEILFI